MTDKSSRTAPGRNNKTSLPPKRSYMVGSAFGPLAKNLDKIEVKVLSEIERGGPLDWRPGRR